MSSSTSSKLSTVDRNAARLRPVVIGAFAVGASISSGIALAEHGLTTVIFGVISLSIVLIALHRLRKEMLLLRDRATTIATITDWERTEGSEGGYFYSIRYKFVARDGQVYFGKASAQAELPAKGELLPISYRSDEPSENLPLATFWFFDFTYTGFQDWMDSDVTRRSH